MFLEPLVRRNRRLIEAAIQLHQEHQIPANSYVLDLDQIGLNARTLAATADRLGLTVFPMTKQLGRNPALLQTLSDAGLGEFVAVDMADARAVHSAGHRLGHIGHLVQVPTAEARVAAGMAPAYWTVYSDRKAEQAADAAAKAGRQQDLLARIFASGNTFYPGHEGGFAAADIVHVADRLDALAHARFAGLTTFPALLFNEATRTVEKTRNLDTLARAADALRRAGRQEVQINAPGTTSSELLPLLASHGATQVEPGHGLTGTTPLHAIRDLPEVTAVLYLSEISHHHAGTAYCFGGGLYVDPVFGDYQVKALVGADPEQALSDRINATLPPPTAIDYYGLLDVARGRPTADGDTVIFAFRIQAFVTRAYVVAVSGLHGGAGPTVAGVWLPDGSRAAWPR